MNSSKKPQDFQKGMSTLFVSLAKLTSSIPVTGYDEQADRMHAQEWYFIEFYFYAAIVRTER